MPKPHARATRAISPGHLPMMVRLLARISRNDLHWLNTLDAQELRALLQLIATAKTSASISRPCLKRTIAIAQVRSGRSAASCLGKQAVGGFERRSACC